MASRPARPAVLVVDDDAFVLAALARLLGGVFEVRVAPDGRGALEVLKTHTVDVVVSDHNLPGMSGSELLAAVRRRYPRVRRVLCSGRPPRRCDAAELVIAKPWPPDFVGMLASLM